jgi:hypothetical protein
MGANDSSLRRTREAKAAAGKPEQPELGVTPDHDTATAEIRQRSREFLQYDDRMQLPDRLLLPFTFDPGLLARDLQSLASVGWTEHFVKQNYDGDWSVIPLRAQAGGRHPVMMIYSEAPKGVRGTSQNLAIAESPRPSRQLANEPVPAGRP